jgi:transposase-like protein
MKRKQQTEKEGKEETIRGAIGELSQSELKGLSLLGLMGFGSGKLISCAMGIEAEAYLGRGHYEHLAEGQEFLGYRNGIQKTRIDTPIGPVEYDRPKLAYAPNFKSQFHSAKIRRPEEFAAAITDMFVNGVSTRKIKDALKAVTGERARLSKSTVSRITKTLREEFSLWKKRSLKDLEVAYLFLDGIRLGMRMGGKKKDTVMLAYAILKDGKMELLAIDLAQAESDRSWGKFISDLKARGLQDPLLVCSDGNQGAINAIDANFTTSYRQRCLKHRSDNILDAVPEENQNEVWGVLHQVFYGATSLEQAKQAVQKFKKEFSKKYPTAVARLEEDLDQCLAFYLFPANHWKRIRTSNKLERLNREIRRRLDVIGRHPDELGCLTLVYAVTQKYAKNKMGFKVNDLVKALWKRLREEKVSMQEQLELDLTAA